MSSRRFSPTSVGVSVAPVTVATASDVSPCPTKDKKLPGTQTQPRHHHTYFISGGDAHRGSPHWPADSDTSLQSANSQTLGSNADGAEGGMRDRCGGRSNYNNMNNSDCSLSPHAPMSRPPLSLLTMSNGAAPPLPRRHVSLPAHQAAHDATSSPPWVASRRAWMHFADREVLTASPLSQPTDRSVEEEAVRVTRTRSLTGVVHEPSVPPAPPVALTSSSAQLSRCAGAAKEERGAEERALSSAVAAVQNSLQATPCLHGDAAAKVPSTSSSPMLLSPVPAELCVRPRSPAQHQQNVQNGASLATEEEAPTAFEKVEGREVSSSPSPIRAPSIMPHEGAVTPTPGPHSLPPEVKALASFLPVLATSTTSWSEERDGGGGGTTNNSQTPPTTLSCPRPRLHPSVTSHRFSRQTSLSFEYAEEDKTAASTTNSDSFPLHGLSPSSAVPSETHSSTLPTGPLHFDLLWRGRSSRVDARSPPSSTSSPQRRDLEPLPSPRSASTTLAERRVSLISTPQPSGGRGDILSSSVSGSATRRVESATLRPAHLIFNPPPRTRSAAYYTTARGTRHTPNLTRGPSDATELLACAARYPRSVSSHSIGATPTTTEVPLRPHLNPLLHSPSSTPRLSGSQPPLSPLQFRFPISNAPFEATGDDVAGHAARSRSISVDELFPLSHAITPFASPWTHHGQSALPSIAATSLAAAIAGRGDGLVARTGMEGPAPDSGAGNNGRCRSSPRKSLVSFSVPSAGDTEAEEGVADGSMYNSAREGGDDEVISVVDYASPNPPPPPWTPAEAIYWMSSRLTRQEVLEMRQYDRIYYCGPAVPPRTACGVTEAVPSPPNSPPLNGDVKNAEENGRTAQEWAAKASTSSFSRAPPAVAHALSRALTATGCLPSSPSYFPITLGMHISFRYEVAEVLGFGTFSVVVRAIDHAPPPLSPERHCALKLIRKEALYQQAAEEEWNVYERVKMCCEDDDETGRQDANTHLTGPSAPCRPHRSFSSSPSPWGFPSSCASFTRRLTPSDLRTLLVASVLTPRTRFEFHGYHVIVFPLLGFNVRDVLELQRECEETVTAEAAATAAVGVGVEAEGGGKEQDESEPDESGFQRTLAFPSEATNSAVGHSAELSASVHTAPSVFPPVVAASVLAQVVHALAFLHHKAHLVHGDLKPENIVFVDRALNHGVAEGHPILPLSEHSHLSHNSAGDGTAAASTPIRFVSLLRPGGCHAEGGVGTVPSLARTSLPSKCIGDGESPVPTSAAALEEVATTENGPATPVGSFHLHGGTHAEEQREVRHKKDATADDDGGATQAAHPPLVGPKKNSKMLDSTAATPPNHDLRGSLSVAYAPHTSSRRTPGLTASGIGTFPSSPHFSRAVDALTLDDSYSDRAATSSVPPSTRNSSAGHSLCRRESLFTHHNGRSAPSPWSELYGSASSPSASVWGTTSRVAVIDLGHAKHLAPGQAGVAFPLQSPSYRAPEMALRLPYTTAIDMWSLGCVLYELRTGCVLFPSASDDATMLAAAVEVLGMPDTNFLAMVKACWREYKQRKTSGVAFAICNNSVASQGTSLSVHLSEQQQEQPEVSEGQKEEGGNGVATAVAAAGSLYQEARPALMPSDEEVAVERCWRSFIQVLNNTAGQQRMRADRRRRQSTSTNVSTTNSPSKAADAGASTSTSSPSCVVVEDAAEVMKRVWRTTTWETAAQCALLSELFPDRQVDTAEHTLSLQVTACHRRSSTSMSTILPQQQQQPSYAWADFLLGCLYWDASERLSSAEAQRHPYVAQLFSAPAPASGEGSEDAAEQRAVAAALGGAVPQTDPFELPPHCSGVYYLQHHPLTARLFSSRQQQHGNGRRRDSKDGDRQESSQSQSLPPGRRPSVTLPPLLPLSAAAVVPFELPSNKRTAPTARAWEEHQQQQQPPPHALTTGERHLKASDRLTPCGQRISVFCGRLPSPEAEEEEATDDPHACASVATTTPLHLAFDDSYERVSTSDADLVSPDRIIEMEEGDSADREGVVSPHRQAHAALREEHEVMVLRLD